MSVKERHGRERRARRETILSAAARVFARRGLEHSTIGMIAREAEVAVGTIYLYFSSRDDLFLTLTAERIQRLNDRYREIQARRLAPLEELRAVVSAYFEYLAESRELFLTQQSAGYAHIRKRLKHRGEIERYDTVLKLGRECFELWAKSVSRVCEAGSVDDPNRRALVAAVIWAGLNGTFLLTGRDSAFFREVSGLSPDDFLEQALDFHLKAVHPSAFGISASSASPLAVPERGNGVGASYHPHGSNGANSKARAETNSNNSKEKTGDLAAAMPHE
jgi:AcrR family transcriptional regulator